MKRVVLHPSAQKLEYEYVLDGTPKKAQINEFNFDLDYRTNKDANGVNIRNSLARKRINITHHLSANNRLPNRYLSLVMRPIFNS